MFFPLANMINQDLLCLQTFNPPKLNYNFRLIYPNTLNYNCICMQVTAKYCHTSEQLQSSKNCRCWRRNHSLRSEKGIGQHGTEFNLTGGGEVKMIRLEVQAFRVYALHTRQRYAKLSTPHCVHKFPFSWCKGHLKSKKPKHTRILRATKLVNIIRIARERLPLMKSIEFNLLMRLSTCRFIVEQSIVLRAWIEVLPI